MKATHLIVAVALTLSVLLPGGLSAKTNEGLPDKVVAGVLELPPFAMKSSDGRWEGLGINLWRAAADDMNVDFELRTFDSIEAVANAVEKKEIDVLPVAIVAPDRELILDFTNHYYRSGLAIAVRAEKAGHGWWLTAERLVSGQFLAVIGSLILLWGVAGGLVWLFENRRNREMFGEELVKGIGHGIWWAAVTMTTVGYGDKAPKTTGGRVVAVVWMLVSIVVISSFTATITTSLTVSQLSGKVRGQSDLPNVRVGSMAQSWAQNWLRNRGIATLSFINDRDGLQALIDSEIDAFVHDQSILTYLATNQYVARVRVLPE